MSWSIYITNAADKEAAKAELAEKAKSQIEHGHMPQSALDAAASAIDGLPDCENSVINLSTYGHYHKAENGRGTSNATLNVSNHFAENVKP